MRPDTSKDIAYCDKVFMPEASADTEHHIHLQATCRIMQRKMDEGFTPIGMYIGDMAPASCTLGDKTINCVAREVTVIMRPGKSDVTFAEWLTGSKFQ